MIHFFIKQKIHLDAFTDRRDVIEYAPIVNAIEVIPNWWRNLPKADLSNKFYPQPTMKTCAGVIDYYAKSIAIPMWSDLCVNVINGSYRWQYSDEISDAIVHSTNQYKGFLDSQEYGHVKLISPWILQSKQDVYWMFTDPVYNRNEFRNYTFMQGLLNFSRQLHTNIQLLIDLKVDRTFTIPFKTPFILTPLSDKKLVIHRHLVSNSEIESKRQTSNSFTFINKYKNAKKITKCPYIERIK